MNRRSFLTTSSTALVAAMIPFSVTASSIPTPPLLQGLNARFASTPVVQMMMRYQTNKDGLQMGFDNVNTYDDTYSMEEIYEMLRDVEIIERDMKYHNSGRISDLPFDDQVMLYSCYLRSTANRVAMKTRRSIANSFIIVDDGIVMFYSRTMSDAGELIDGPIGRVGDNQYVIIPASAYETDLPFLAYFQKLPCDPTNPAMREALTGKYFTLLKGTTPSA